MPTSPHMIFLYDILRKIKIIFYIIHWEIVIKHFNNFYILYIKYMTKNYNCN